MLQLIYLLALQWRLLLLLVVIIVVVVIIVIIAGFVVDVVCSILIFYVCKQAKNRKLYNKTCQLASKSVRQAGRLVFALAKHE